MKFEVIKSNIGITTIVHSNSRIMVASFAIDNNGHADELCDKLNEKYKNQRIDLDDINDAIDAFIWNHDGKS